MNRQNETVAADPIFRLPPLRIEAMYTALAETVDWGLAAYHVPDHWKSTRGQGVRVAVLDTGLDMNHPDLAGAVDDACDFTDSPRGAADGQGHGTHVAGTIAARQNEQGVVGVAPECRLLVGKVLGDDGSGTSEQVARGIDWAVAAGADILSLSLGSPDASTAIKTAIERAVAEGKFVICAAGNEGRDDAVNYPAKWESTIAVGAVDRLGQSARFSSRGPEVDVCAGLRCLVDVSRRPLRETLWNFDGDSVRDGRRGVDAGQTSRCRRRDANPQQLRAARASAPHGDGCRADRR